MRTAFALLVLLAGCASDKYRPHTTEWDDDDEGQVARAPHEEPAAQKTITARELADRLRTAKECQDKALDYFKGDRTRGLTLLKACTERPDFTELAWLLQKPWAAEIAEEPALQVALAGVIARRGGFVERDTFLARAAGIPLHDVNSAVAKDPVGKLVVVRGAVSNVAAGLATISESSWADLPVEDGRAPEAKEETEKTGRDVFANLKKKDPALGVNKQLVVVLRHEAKRTHKDENDEDVPTISGDFVAAFDAATSLAP